MGGRTDDPLPGSNSNGWLINQSPDWNGKHDSFDWLILGPLLYPWTTMSIAWLLMLCHVKSYHGHKALPPQHSFYLPVLYSWDEVWLLWLQGIHGYLATWCWPCRPFTGLQVLLVHKELGWSSQSRADNRWRKRSQNLNYYQPQPGR